jgi:2-keto-4-pentenoate hydratase/2-oxohepta-3-ene-1,7-dioic acid hydratase in catechol pathway
MDEIGDPHNLDIKLFLNGEEKQNSNTKELIFNCYDLIEHLSTAFTLMPGDVVPTGTSGGVLGVEVMAGRASWLQEGDEIKIELEKVGTLSNKVVKEPDSTKFIA